MEFQDVINKRHTVREFSKEAIPFKLIEKSLNSGLQAPSYNHLKHWDFILVPDIKTRLQIIDAENIIEYTKVELDQIFKDVDTVAKNMYLDAIPRQKKMILNAPELLIVVYSPKTKLENCSRIYDLNCLASVWCCIENILLSLAEDEIYAVTFVPKNTEPIKKVLGIPPVLEIAAIIPFGYKSKDAKTIQSKVVKLSDKLHRNKW